MANKTNTDVDIETIVQEAFEHYRDHPDCLLGRCASLAPLKQMSSHELLDVLMAFEADPDSPPANLHVDDLSITEILRHKVASHILARLSNDRHAGMAEYRAQRQEEARLIKVYSAQP